MKYPFDAFRFNFISNWLLRLIRPCIGSLHGIEDNEFFVLDDEPALINNNNMLIIVSICSN